MFFASDNSGPVHPAILESLSRVNAGYAMGYGNDPYSASVNDKIRDAFEAPEAAVYLVPTGTAANSLILATMTNRGRPSFAHRWRISTATNAMRPNFTWAAPS